MKETYFVVYFLLVQAIIPQSYGFYIVSRAAFTLSRFGMILLIVTTIDCAPQKRPFRLDLTLTLPSLQTVDLQTQKEKGQTCCCIQSHSCGQGKRRAERMPAGFAMESE